MSLSELKDKITGIHDFITTCHAYQFYEKIKDYEAPNNLLLDSLNPREMFNNAFEKKLGESNAAYDLVKVMLHMTW